MNPRNRGSRRGDDRTDPAFGWLLGASAAALVVKSIVLAQLGGHPLLQPHGTLDSAYYVELASKIANGGPSAVAGPFFVSPLYVFFLALVIKSSGGSLLTSRVVQIVLGSAAVGLLYSTARIWFRERIARIAAVLFVLTGFFTFSEIVLIQASLDPFLTSFALYFLSRSQIDERRRILVAAGISMGLLALNRPNALVFGLAAAALLSFESWRRPTQPVFSIRARNAALRSSAFLLGMLAVVGPNAIRNYAGSGEVILISSHGGLNFFIGNHAGADGTYQRIAGITPSIAGQARDVQRVAEQAAGRPLSAGEASSYFYSLAADWIEGNPGDALKLFLRKIAILANKTNVALNYSYAYYSREPTLLRFLFIGPWLLLPLGLTGLFLRSQRTGRPGYWLWASFVPIYGLSVALFFVSDRYRQPLLIPLCISSAATITWVIDRARARRGVVLCAPAMVLAFVCTATWWNIGLNDGFDDEQTTMAVWLIEQGNREAAMSYVESISARHRHPGMLRFQVGTALSASGRFEEAMEQFQQALALDPGENAIHLALGQALAALKRPAEAIPHLIKVCDSGYQQKVSAPLLAWALASTGRSDEALKRLREYPDELVEQSETGILLGTIAFEGHDLAQAARWLRIAVTLGPEQPEASARLGAVLLLLNRPQEAVPPLETAIRLDPQNAGAHRNLALALAGSGRFAEARVQGDETLRLNPNEPQIQALMKSLPAAGRR